MNFDQLLYIFVSPPTMFFSLFLCFFIAWFFLGSFMGADQDFGCDVDIDSTNISSKFFVSVGLGKVPLSIGLSFTSLVGTAISMMVQLHILSLFFTYDDSFNGFSTPYLILSLTIFFPILLVSLWVAGKMVAPLGGFFDDSEQRLTFSYEGKDATINSLTVEPNFGEAVLKDHDGVEHTLNVRTHDEEPLKHGDKVLITTKSTADDNTVYFVTKHL
jgi:hypothetical protein